MNKEHLTAIIRASGRQISICKVIQDWYGRDKYVDEETGFSYKASELLFPPINGIFVSEYTFEQIQNALLQAKNAILGITALDSAYEIQKKTEKGETAVIRSIDNALKLLKNESKS